MMKFYEMRKTIHKLSQYEIGYDQAVEDIEFWENNKEELQRAKDHKKWFKDKIESTFDKIKNS